MFEENKALARRILEELVVKMNMDNLEELFDVVSRWSSAFTHTGVLFGVPATGKRVKQSGIMIYRIKNGKVVEQWAEANMWGLMQQLGVVSPPSAKES